MQHAEGGLWQLNHHASGPLYRLPPELYRLLRLCQIMHGRSDGLFDPALHGSVMDIELADHYRVRKRSDTQLDLGGIAKGYIVDLACMALKSQGAAYGLVDAGGDMRCFGRYDWPITIASPFHASERMKADMLRGNMAIASSCITASSAERGGKSRADIPPRYKEHPVSAHIVHASIRHLSCMMADMLATLCLLNPAKALELLGRGSALICTGDGEWFATGDAVT